MDFIVDIANQAAQNRERDGDDARSANQSDGGQRAPIFSKERFDTMMESDNFPEDPVIYDENVARG
jgi:hypothetical protein